MSIHKNKIILKIVSIYFDSYFKKVIKKAKVILLFYYSEGGLSGNGGCSGKDESSKASLTTILK